MLPIGPFPRPLPFHLYILAFLILRTTLVNTPFRIMPVLRTRAKGSLSSGAQHQTFLASSSSRRGGTYGSFQYPLIQSFRPESLGMCEFYPYLLSWRFSQWSRRHCDVVTTSPDIRAAARTWTRALRLPCLLRLHPSASLMYSGRSPAATEVHH